MPLIKSISGIRGTIGGISGENLTPLDIIRFIAADVLFLKQNYPDIKLKIIVGRDGRISGEMVKNLVIGMLLSLGADVIDLGMATTPTVEMTVIQQAAQGGIMISASHNPAGWNALKLLNGQGEFFSAADGQEILKLAEKADINFATEEQSGQYVFNPFLAENHLNAILNLATVKKTAIANKKFKIVVDGINSVGGIIVPELLKALGVSEVIEINCQPDGRFAHKPEPLAENLTQIMEKVKATGADLGIVVDPDVDRLAFIDENGEMFGEEYTLVAVADYVLENYKSLETKYPGKYQKATVSNLSSSRALKDITEQGGGKYEAAAVGEVNVVQKMKELKAVVGGEGNGGVIFPELHYGRDALVGIALFLSALAGQNKKISEFKKQFPMYFMVKDRLELTDGLDVNKLLADVEQAYKTEQSSGSGDLKITNIDGVKIDWPDSWVHLRASNTEPIIRIYAEAKTSVEAAGRIKEIKERILAYIK
jgi:phosphomannomutase